MSALLQAMNDLCAAAWDALDRGDDDALLATLEARDRLQPGALEIGDDESAALALSLHRWNGRLEERIRARRDEASAELRQLQKGTQTLAGYATSPQSQFHAVG